MPEHNFKEFPELRNNQLNDFQLISPHKQITEDFRAKVVKVHDGDTVTLRIEEREFDFPLRVVGVDAKELSEGGQEAAAWLRERIEGEEVDIILDPKRVDKWGRLLGKIIHRGMDPSEEMMWLGLVKTYENRNEGIIINPIKEVFDAAS